MKLTHEIAFAAAVALAGIGNSASAAFVDISSGTGGFWQTPATGVFSNTYEFTLSSRATVNLVLSSVVGGNQDLDFTSVVLTGPSGPVSGSSLTPDPLETWGIANAVLEGGSYTLTATGINSAGIASYAGMIALSGSSNASASGAGGPLDLSSGSTGFVHTPKAGAFSDAYTFTINNPTAVNVLLSSVVGGNQDVDFTSLVLSGPSGLVNGVAYTMDPFENWTLSSPVLMGGNYTLTASGINSDAIGTYVGTIALAGNGTTPPNSVPEPGTWALLLTALGAAQVCRRRRAPGSAAHS